MRQEEIVKMALDAGLGEELWIGQIPEGYTDATPKLLIFAKAIEKAERAKCISVCRELGEHWAAYKDTALLNGNVALSNAYSGEPRAAEAIAAEIERMP